MSEETLELIDYIRNIERRGSDVLPIIRRFGFTLESYRANVFLLERLGDEVYRGLYFNEKILTMADAKIIVGEHSDNFS